MWRRHWKDSKRFYKPELDAAHDPAPQAIKLRLKLMQLFWRYIDTLAGYNDKLGFLT
jgi:hypothetical protein